MGLLCHRVKLKGASTLAHTTLVRPVPSTRLRLCFMLHPSAGLEERNGMSRAMPLFEIGVIGLWTDAHHRQFRAFSNGSVL